MNDDIVFEKMNLVNVMEMRNFGKNSDPLLSSYDFWPRSPEECEFWFKKKTEHDYNRYFVARFRNKIFLYLSIKKIDRQEGSSILGIVEDPNYIDRGLGTRALALFLDYYFGDAGFKLMYLTVDIYNKRALRVYEKLGFQKLRRGYQVIDFSPKLINKDNRKFFVESKGIYFSKVYFMSLSREKFLHN